MFLKVIIVILFIAIVASLSSGLVFLLKGINTPDSKLTLYALGVRISLATLLMLLIGYGVSTGQLSSTAPWEKNTLSSAKMLDQKN